jgi:hypothetical protein
MMFCQMVEQRAAADAIDSESVLVQVHRVLASLGIPWGEFYQFEKETSEHDD